MDPHRMGGYHAEMYEWLEYMKKQDEKEFLEGMHQRKASPQNHEANDVQRRSADSEGGRRRREIVRSL